MLNSQARQLRFNCAKRNQLVCHLNTACGGESAKMDPEECLYAPVRGLSAVSLNRTTTSVTLLEAAIQISHVVSSQVTMVERASAEANAYGFNQSIDDEGVMHYFSNSHSTEHGNVPVDTAESQQDPQDHMEFAAAVSYPQTMNLLNFQSPSVRSAVKDGQQQTTTIFFSQIQKFLQLQDWLIFVTQA